MAALHSATVLAEDAPAAARTPTSGAESPPFAPEVGLPEPDRRLLERIAAHLPLLADLTHADAVLFARAGGQAKVVAQAQPVPVPSPYVQPLAVGRILARDEAPGVYRVLFERHNRHHVTTTVIRGAPVLQE